MEQTRVWIAHSANDPIASVCHGFEQDLYDEVVVLNDLSIFSVRDPSDTKDSITQGIQSADTVIALLTPDTDEDDLIAQLRRASSLKKQILALFFWGRGERSPKTLPQSTELRNLLSGHPHLYVHTSGLVDKFREILNSRVNMGIEASSNNKRIASSYDVFISKKSVDYEPAKQVHEFLISKGKKVFLSEPSLLERGSSDYMKEIDTALDTARNLILVARSVDNIMSGWVEAEWRLFINEKRSGRKDGNLVTLLDSEIPPSDLPLSLRYFEVIPLKTENFNKLLNYI